MKTEPSQFARDVGSLVIDLLSPPSIGAPGGLGSGSATEDRTIDQWRQDAIGRLRHLLVVAKSPGEIAIIQAIAGVAFPGVTPPLIVR